MEVHQQTSYKDGPQQIQHEKVEIYRRLYHVPVQRSRANDGPSPRVPTVVADMLSSCSYRIQRYSE